MTFWAPVASTAAAAAPRHVRTLHLDALPSTDKDAGRDDLIAHPGPSRRKGYASLLPDGAAAARRGRRIGFRSTGIPAAVGQLAMDRGPARSQAVRRDPAEAAACRVKGPPVVENEGPTVGRGMPSTAYAGQAAGCNDLAKTLAAVCGTNWAQGPPDAGSKPGQPGRRPSRTRRSRRGSPGQAPSRTSRGTDLAA
jgi:hypothetical protein